MKKSKNKPFFQASDYVKQYGKNLNLKGIKQAVFCFNSSLAKKLSEKHKPKKTFAFGACLDIYKDFQKVLISQFGFGAPASLLQLEYMKTFGIKEFFSVGTACALSSELKTAQGVFIEKAYSRRFYSAHENSSCSFVENPYREEGKKWVGFFNLIPVTSWTSDAPYQETELKNHLTQGVSCLEMEAGALMSRANENSLKMFCFAFISDVLKNGKWHLSFSNPELKEKSFLLLEKLLRKV